MRQVTCMTVGRIVLFTPTTSGMNSTDPPLPTIQTNFKNFIGDESVMPTPPVRKSPSPAPRNIRSVSEGAPNPFAAAGFEPSAVPDPSVWMDQQQQQFLQALMASGPLSRSPESLPGLTPTDVDPTLPPMDNPFAAMLFSKDGGGFSPGAMGKAPADAAVPPAPTRLQKWMPFIHVVTTWCLLAYFVLYMEPHVQQDVGVNFEGSGLWRRWAELGRTRVVGDVAQVLKVQVVVRENILHLFRHLTSIAASVLGFHNSTDSSSFGADIFWIRKWLLTSHQFGKTDALARTLCNRQRYWPSFCHIYRHLCHQLS